jgi:predicted PurR-regulated permease PerM
MVLVTGNWRIALAGLAASLLIFGVLFFTVIQPSSNTANQAIKSGLQQSQQVLNQAQKQLNSAANQASSASSQAGAATSQAQKQVSQATGQAQQQLSKAAKLANCLAQAGTDASKLQTCQANFGH